MDYKDLRCLTFGPMNTRIKAFAKRITRGGQDAELALGSAFLLAAKVFGAVSGYLMAWLLAKRGGADVVGIYELAFTFIILLSVVSRYGLDTAIVRFIGKFEAEHTLGAIRWLYIKSMRFSGLTALGIATLVFLLAPFCSQVFSDDDHLTLPLRWAAASIPLFTLINMNAETLRGFKLMLPYSLLQQGSVIFVAVLFFNFWWNNEAVGVSGVQSFFLASIVLYGYSQYQVKQKFKHLPPLQAPAVTFKAVKKIAWPMFLSSSIFMLISWTDTLMVGYYLADADVGVYRIAFRVSTVITFAQFAINGIAAPMIAKLYHANDLAGLRSLIYKVGVFNFIFSVPIILIILFAPSLLLGFFGPEFVSGRPLLLILSAGQAVFALSGPVLYILTMTRHEKTSLRIMYLSAGVNLVGNAILIPLYGLKGAAIATMFTTVLWNVIAVYMVYKYLHVVSISFIGKWFSPKEDINQS